MRKFMLACILICIGLAACTKIQLCDYDHPHEATVRFDYDWSEINASGATLPDSMTNVVNRIIRSRRTTLGISTADNTGKYDSIPDSLTEAENTGISAFKVSDGEYKFLTINRKEAYLDYPRLDSFLLKQEGVHGFGEVWIEYHTYDSTSVLLESPASEWTDFNRYTHNDGTFAEYMMSDVNPIAVDSTAVIKFDIHDDQTVQFTPKMLSQNIDIYFDIQKELGAINFTIDSVYCIISGIPHRVNLATQKLDISSTDKMIFRSHLVSPASVPTTQSPDVTDTYTNNTVRCYKNVNVTGIVENDSAGSDIYTGPGIFQAMVYLTVDKVGKPKYTRMVNAMMNIHNSLVAAKLVEFDNDKMYYHKTTDHAVLFIDIDATIKQAFLEGSESGGIDEWKDKTVQGDGDDGGFDVY